MGRDLSKGNSRLQRPQSNFWGAPIPLHNAQSLSGFCPATASGALPRCRPVRSPCPREEVANARTQRSPRTHTHSHATANASHPSPQAPNGARSPARVPIAGQSQATGCAPSPSPPPAVFAGRRATDTGLLPGQGSGASESQTHTATVRGATDARARTRKLPPNLTNATAASRPGSPCAI